MMLEYKIEILAVAIIILAIELWFIAGELDSQAADLWDLRLTQNNNYLNAKTRSHKRAKTAIGGTRGLA